MLRNRHETLTQCWLNAGPALSQHWMNASCFCTKSLLPGLLVSPLSGIHVCRLFTGRLDPCFDSNVRHTPATRAATDSVPGYAPELLRSKAFTDMRNAKQQQEKRQQKNSNTFGCFSSSRRSRRRRSSCSGWCWYLVVYSQEMYLIQLSPRAEVYFSGSRRVRQ